jgi:hypothetical protein
MAVSLSFFDDVVWWRLGDFWADEGATARAAADAAKSKCAENMITERYRRPFTPLNTG